MSPGPRTRGGRRPRPARRGEQGFTLIELAIVMAVAGLMLAGAMKLLGGQLDQSRLKATRDRLQMAYDALVTFYAANSYLPCPADGALAASDADYGRAQPETSGACAGVAAVNQVLPWRTLGLQEELSFDGWRQRLSYRVSPPLTTAGAAGPGDLSVRDGAVSVPGTTELTAAAAFVVMSHGENGLGAWLPSSLRKTKTTAGIPAHEDENADGAEPYVDKAQSQATGDEFDDLVADEAEVDQDGAEHLARALLLEQRDLELIEGDQAEIEQAIADPGRGLLFGRRPGRRCGRLGLGEAAIEAHRHRSQRLRRRHARRTRFHRRRIAACEA